MSVDRVAAALAFAAAAIVPLVAASASAAEDVRACAAEPALAQLDFWLGDWDVCVAGEWVGRDRVAKMLDGCAVSEEWTASDGTRGTSLFYYAAGERQWKQVWVTDRALVPGGLKEKHLVARFADGGVRFQGEIALPDGRRVLDRTTLRPAAGKSVSQRIEISRDGGDTWTTTFDAAYRPRPSAPTNPVASDAAAGGKKGR
ncbi:MAG: hypothetical protein ACXWIG_00555 [Caldimonas sp.]